MLEKIVSFCLFAISLLTSNAGSLPEIPKRCFDPALAGGALQVKDGFLYAAGSGKIAVYSLKDPKNPQFVSSCPVFNSRQMRIQGDRLYLTGRNCGLWIFDVGNPRKIRRIRHVATAELATGLEVYGDLLLVGLRNYGTEVFDLRDKDNPASLGLFKTPEAQSVVMHGKYCYTGDWQTNTVGIVNLSDPARPVNAGEICTEGFTDGLCVQNNLLYVATGHHNCRHTGKFVKIGKNDVANPGFGAGHGLEIFDLKNPEVPEFLGRVKFNRFYDVNHDYWKVVVSGSVACVGDTFNGFYTVDVSDPRNPVITGRAVLPEVDNPPFLSKHNRKFKRYADCVKDVAAGTGVVYAAGLKSGLWVMECPGVKPLERPIPEKISGSRKITPLKLPENLVQTAETGHVYRLAVRGDTVYAACANAGLKVYRINGNELKLLQRISPVSGPARCCYDVLLNGDKLYAACGEYLMIFDVKPDGRLKKVLKPVKKRMIQFQLLHLYGKRLAVSCGASGVTVWDLDKRGVPVYAGNYRTGYHLYGDYLSDGALDGEFVFHNGSSALTRCKLSDCGTKANQEVSCGTRGCMTAGIAVWKKYFVLANGRKISFFDPAANRTFTVDSDADGVPSLLNDGTLVFSQRIRSRIYVVQLTDSPQLKVLAAKSFQLPGAIPGKVQFNRGRMLIPTWKYGIILEKLPPAE